MRAVPLLGTVVLVGMATRLNAQTLRPQSLREAPSPSVSVPKLASISLKGPAPYESTIDDFLNAPTPDSKTCQIIINAFDQLARAWHAAPKSIGDEVSTLSAHTSLVEAAAATDDTAWFAVLTAFSLDASESALLTRQLKKIPAADANSATCVSAVDAVKTDIGLVQQSVNTASSDQIFVSLLAQGSVRGAVSGADSSGGAGTGSVGLAVSYGNFTLSGLVTVASTVDTLRSGFGGFLLTPANGRGSLSTFLLDAYTPSLGDVLSHWFWGGHTPVPAVWPGLHLYVEGANSTWRADTGKSAVTTYEQAAALGWGVLANWRLVKGHLQDVPVEIHAELGASVRNLRGDAGADSTFIRAALGYTGAHVPRNWAAFEAGYQMKIGSVTAGTQYYYIGGRATPGLTSGQLVIGIAVAGNVVSGVLSP